MNKKIANELLGRPDMEAYQAQQKYPIVVVLDDIRSLSNVGSIFRTADAFNVQEVVLCGITGRPPHREIQRTALGATESVQWKYADDAVGVIEDLKQRDYLIIALEQCEEHVHPSDWSSHHKRGVCLILGNEVEGVKQSLIDASDVVMEIPQLGTKHSLNVTVAGGIALWEVFKYFHKT